MNLVINSVFKHFAILKFYFLQYLQKKKTNNVF
jgi:hypothetical protein